MAEIERLKIDNHELTGRIAEMEGIIEDFGDYFRILNYYDRFDKFKTGKFAATVEKNKNKIIAKEKTRGNMKSMTTSVEENLSLVNQALKLRTDSISNTLKIASLDRKIAQNSHEHNGDVNSALRQSIKRLNSLESFLNSIPIVRPMDNYRVSSHYGLRLDPFDKVKRMHRGIDLVGPYKSKIFVPADGIVRFVSKNKKLGNTVVVYHGNDIVTKYGHLGDIYVSVGDQVKKGDVLAVQGNTGRSTGNHLHYEISVNNINQDPNDFFKIGDKLGIQLDLGKLLNKNSTSAGNSKNVKYNIVVPADRKY
ncbi:MAG: M23 family metallopeptidase [Rickettsiales bacterium]|nr:M23 family metallopeptidase [Rickettsiales bacterium]